MEPHCVDAPSPWVVRWAALIARGPVLDLACGSGRHARFLSGRSLQVVAVDRGAQALPADIRFVQFDLESSAPWPFRGERFGAIVVTNYLHRPLFPDIAASLGEGGVLIYETFMVGNERYGKPSNPNFLLRPGELLQAFRQLEVIAFEQAAVSSPKLAVVQRLCARSSGSVPEFRG